MYPKKWLVVLIWILSSVGIVNGVLWTAFHFWANGRNLSIAGAQGQLAWHMSLWLILLFNVAFWSSLCATIGLLALLCSQTDVTAKWRASSAVICAWLGMLPVILWRDIRL